MRGGGRRPPGPRPPYNPGQQQMQASSWGNQGSHLAPPMGPAMWGSPQPPMSMHGGGFPGFMPHDQFGPGRPGAWGPFGPGMHPGNATPRPAWGGSMGRSPGRSPGRGPPGRGRNLGRAFPKSTGGRLPSRGRAMPSSNGMQQGRGQATPQKHSQQSQGQGQGKSKKQKLAEMDDTPPKPWKPLNPAEIADGQRWQEERRKRYPTESNVAKRAEQASARRQRGELDPEGEATCLRLHEVIARQQELSVLKEAGTADLLWAASGRGGGFRGGHGGRAGRHGSRGVHLLMTAAGPGRGQGFAGDNKPGRGHERSGVPLNLDADAKKQAMQAAAPASAVADDTALNGLAGYGSDSDREGPEGSGAALQSDGQDQQPQPCEQQQKQVGNFQPIHYANGGTRGGRHGIAYGRGREWHPCQPVVVRDPSLLEKLLATDIRAEHSRLLQCMRFLVANNFLQDVGSKPLLYPPEPPTAPGQLPGIPITDLPEDSDDSDDAEEAAPAEVDIAGQASDKVEADEGITGVNDSSASGTEEEVEEAEEEISSGGGGEENRVDCQAMEHAPLQK